MAFKPRDGANFLEQLGESGVGLDALAIVELSEQLDIQGQRQHRLIAICGSPSRRGENPKVASGNYRFDAGARGEKSDTLLIAPTFYRG